MGNRHSAAELKQMQSLPLEAKIRMSEERIKVWYESWVKFEIYNGTTGKNRFTTIDTRGFEVEPLLKENEWIKSAVDGQVYVSFSGGKDSTVLADLCVKVCKKYGWSLYLFLANTGLEYPEIQKFVKIYAEWLRNTYKIEVVLDIVRPEMRFDEVIKKYGYPAISKDVSNCVYGAKRNSKVRMERLNGTLKNKDCQLSMFNCAKWKFLLDAPFDVSDQCCDVMKKKPAKQYGKQTGKKPILGMLASESVKRKNAWMKTGCNAFDKRNPQSQPMSFWTEQDVLRYIKEYNIPFCSVYGEIIEKEGDLKTTCENRTGCIFCMFGCHLEKEPNRFQRLKETHPRQYEYCINGGEMVDGKWRPNKEGLGLGKVLDYIGVKYE